MYFVELVIFLDDMILNPFSKIKNNDKILKYEFDLSYRKHDQDNSNYIEKERDILSGTRGIDEESLPVSFPTPSGAQ